MSESKQNWSIPIEGVIHVPDELDPLINSIGFQYRLHTISRRFSEPEFICRAVYAAEQFFTEKYSAELEQLRKENEKYRQALESIVEYVDANAQPSVHAIRNTAKQAISGVNK